MTENEVEALADCVMGGVPLRRGERRLIVEHCALEIGTTTLSFESASADSELATHELAQRYVVDSRLPARILVVQGANVGKTYALEAGQRHRVGRGAHCEIRLDDSDVSRVHCEILQPEKRHVIVRDLKSTAGTFLGRTRLAAHRKARWKPQRMVRLGSTVLALLLPFDLEGSEPVQSSDDEVEVLAASPAPARVEAVGARRRGRTLQPLEIALVIWVLVLIGGALGLLVWLVC